MSTQAHAPIFSGGFSREVVEHHIFQNYISSGDPGGYIGSSERTSSRDRTVERYLRLTGLGAGGVALWLTSTSARHMMDSVDRRTPASAFEEHVANFTASAFSDVTIWAHPDHRGSMASTMELRQKIFGERQ